MLERAKEKVRIVAAGPAGRIHFSVDGYAHPLIHRSDLHLTYIDTHAHTYIHYRLVSISKHSNSNPRHLTTPTLLIDSAISGDVRRSMPKAGWHCTSQCNVMHQSRWRLLPRLLPHLPSCAAQTSCPFC